MAGGAPISTGSTSLGNQNTKGYGVAISVMVGLFFMIGFITVLNDVLIPSLKGIFGLNVSESQNVSLVFFGAYGIMAIPSGWVIKQVGYKKGLMYALAAMAAGLLLFIPASMTISFGFFLVALFIVASGLTLLQVAINPYLSALGSPETAESRLNLGGAFNSLATFIGPLIGSTLILSGTENMSNLEKAEAVRFPYVGLATLTVIIMIALSFIKLPKLQLESAKKVNIWDALKFRRLRLGTLAIFFYVGTEVAIGTLLVLYLGTSEMGKVPEEMAGYYLAYYWMLAMVGRFVGSAVLTRIKPNKALAFVSLVAMILVILSMFNGLIESRMNIYVIRLSDFSFIPCEVPVASLMLVLVGLFNSIMWPTIFPLSIKGLGKYTSAGSGFLVTMVIGGAAIPKLQGWLVSNEYLTFRFSFILSIVCYSYILYYALIGYKVRSNEPNTEEEENVPIPNPELV